MICDASRVVSINAEVDVYYEVVVESKRSESGYSAIFQPLDFVTTVVPLH